jgi:tRNA dimethylallyltransferase
MSNIDAVLIAGPTASGKSEAALALAERLGGTIVNTDSMQVYRETRILTARPSAEDEARAPHMLYGHVSVREPYSVGRYQEDAARALDAAKLPIFVGGTGLYFAALTEGIAEIPPVPASIREAVRQKREEMGAEAFHVELAARDPASANLRIGDTQRTLRAMEVLEATGEPLTYWQTKAGKPVLEGRRFARFVLSPPRPVLHARIESRFDAMLDAGAMEEAAALQGVDPSLPASKILGLRELQVARAGRMDLATAATLAKTATRQYAKRQVTWFRRRMADWHWLESGETSNIISEILARLA